VRHPDECNDEILGMQMQKFANLVFAELYRDPDFKLDALVIGHLGPTKRADDHGDWYVMPQFCFVKGEQRNILNRMATVAVPVTGLWYVGRIRTRAFWTWIRWPNRGSNGLDRPCSGSIKPLVSVAQACLELLFPRRIGLLLCY
jgi:hypothetical protein